MSAPQVAPYGDNFPPVPPPTGGGGGPPLSDATPEPVGTPGPGVSADAARGDHVHAHGNQGGDTEHTVATALDAGFMSPAQLAQLDATGPLSNANPIALGPAAPGVLPDASRADHVHAHGDQAGGTLHPAATALAAGFMSPGQLAQLNATGALSNAAPAALGTAAAGASAEASRADHVHPPTLTTQLAAASPTAVSPGVTHVRVTNAAAETELQLPTEADAPIGTQLLIHKENTSTFGIKLRPDAGASINGAAPDATLSPVFFLAPCSTTTGDPACTLIRTAALAWRML